MIWADLLRDWKAWRTSGEGIWFLFCRFQRAAYSKVETLIIQNMHFSPAWSIPSEIRVIAYSPRLSVLHRLNRILRPPRNHGFSIDDDALFANTDIFSSLGLALLIEKVMENQEQKNPQQMMIKVGFAFHSFTLDFKFSWRKSLHFDLVVVLSFDLHSKPHLPSYLLHPFFLFNLIVVVNLFFLYFPSCFHFH